MGCVWLSEISLTVNMLHSSTWDLVPPSLCWIVPRIIVLTRRSCPDWPSQAEVCTQVEINGIEIHCRYIYTNTAPATTGRSTIRVNSSHNNKERSTSAQSSTPQQGCHSAHGVSGDQPARLEHNRACCCTHKCTEIELITSHIIWQPLAYNSVRQRLASSPRAGSRNDYCISIKLKNFWEADNERLVQIKAAHTKLSRLCVLRMG